MESKINTVLITGSTDGIGMQTAKDLAVKGYKVILHGRSQEKINKVLSEIKSQNVEFEPDFVLADLSSIEEIKKMSDAIALKYDSLDILLNNAGVLLKERLITKNGLEMTFGVNHMAYFYLTGKLLPLLLNSKKAKIINVASQAHSSRIDFNNLQFEENFDGVAAYSLSKLCNILFTVELAYKLIDKQITVNCLHPGVISTKLLHAGWGEGWGSELQEGSDNLCDATINPTWDNETGVYFVNQKITEPASIVFDTDIRKKLWQISEEFCEFKYPL